MRSDILKFAASVTVLTAAMTMFASVVIANEPVALPKPKGATVDALKKAKLQRGLVTPDNRELGRKSAAKQEKRVQPGPPPLVSDASGDASKDPRTTYVPGIRRIKPTVPPKPPELQRWLSKL